MTLTFFFAWHHNKILKKVTKIWHIFRNALVVRFVLRVWIPNLSFKLRTDSNVVCTTCVTPLSIYFVDSPCVWTWQVSVEKTRHALLSKEEPCKKVSPLKNCTEYFKNWPYQLAFGCLSSEIKAVLSVRKHLT